MFEREMILSGLQRQRDILSQVIQEIESRPSLDVNVWSFCDAKAGEVAKNLRKLRKIKQNYAHYRQFSLS